MFWFGFFPLSLVAKSCQILSKATPATPGGAARKGGRQRGALTALLLFAQLSRPRCRQVTSLPRLPLAALPLVPRIPSPLFPSAVPGAVPGRGRERHGHSASRRGAGKQRCAGWERGLAPDCGGAARSCRAAWTPPGLCLGLSPSSHRKRVNLGAWRHLPPE